MAPGWSRLNYILKEQKDMKIAVLENEFGPALSLAPRGKGWWRDRVFSASVMKVKRMSEYFIELTL